jgi:hypothetical protein
MDNEDGNATIFYSSSGILPLEALLARLNGMSDSLTSATKCCVPHRYSRSTLRTSTQ